ncbi:DUF3080 family protein [Paraglaciecola arctica]|uniref:DUF3080 family protein n=1 Tax=Paraglaciecola arctica TaxID=1128911 RepID=UPI001C07CD32|nr:DUF3080 family protein [Paraglaciecola arctica]MBU3005260.1 DUF3080 domain-containing protein [Paraglaciecola arctica]
MRYHLFILFLIVLLWGCDSSHQLQNDLQEYQERMANVLDEESPVQLTVSLRPYPPLRELQQNLPETTIKLFEFYEFKHCELYSLVAQRNTTLGNLQLPSTRYVYERQLINGLQQCLEDTQDPKLREKLANWKQIKVGQLPMVWANLMQLSAEMKQGLSSNYGFVKGDERDGLIQSINALKFLLHINRNNQLQSSTLEQHLKILKDNSLPAKLWLSQLTLSKNLPPTTLWLEQHTSDLRCSSSRSRQKLEYLTNVFQRFFIEKIQPTASQINNYHYQFSPIFELIMVHPDLSPHFKKHVKLNQQGFDTYKVAMQQHIQFWQNLYQRCNKQPGKKTQ